MLQQSKLLRKVQNTARKQAYPVLNRDDAIDPEDIDQVAYLSLREAMKTWDPSKKASLASWTYFYVRKNLHKEFYRCRSFDKVDLNEDNAYHDPPGVFFRELQEEDLVSSILDTLGTEGIVPCVDFLITFLTEPHRTVILNLFGLQGEQEVSASKLAVRLGLPVSRVRAIREDALQKLKQKLTEIMNRRVVLSWML